ncbi:oxidoreductase of aldo/keto reductase family, subgroup 1 [Minicystis rosea]|nr:oxidoreductase of aldo/keto reductase family, subgroup 1 [Minicystis rosea]
MSNEPSPFSDTNTPSFSPSDVREAPKRAPELTFGTYRVRGEAAAHAVTRALEAGIRSIDTAHLYKNESAVFGAVRAFEVAHPEAGPIRVCTKIFKHLIFDQTIRAVESSAERLGRALDVVLLHRPLPGAMWRALSACADRGLVKEIGVSNYSATRLSALLSFCNGLEGGPPCRRPALNQIELHPFVGPVQPLLGLCRSEGVRVQGHTVFARGQYFDFAPLVRLAGALGVSPAVVLLRWAQQLGAEVVFHTSREDHLAEVVHATATAAPVLSARDMAEISGYYALETRRFFPEPVSPALHDDELSDVVETTRYVALVAERLDADRRAMDLGLAVSDTALNLPANTNRQLLTDPIANQIALQLFPVEDGKTAEGSYSRFRELIRKLRSSAHAQKDTAPEPKALSCTLHLAHRTIGPQRFVKGEPVSMAVAHPEAMPVEVAPEEELAPFFEFLGDPERLAPEACDATEAPLVFTRGAYFPDERMDLCKQVVGPDHIAKLCEAVERPFVADRAPRWGRVRHFLLGNNIACEGDSLAGARALSRLMANPRAEIETWYLAGNSIGPEDMGVLAGALEGNVHARALWLKRNPLGTEGAAHLGRLLAKNQTLHLLDVHNTGLFDEGIEALARAFASADGDGVLHLRHLYASANALSERSFSALRPLLTKARPSPCSLVSLSLSLNRFGNAGLDAFVDILETGALGNLERLDLGSIGLEKPDLSRLTSALLRHCEKLRSLDLGTYLSTRDLGEKTNRLDSDVTALERLLHEHPALELLDVSICGLPTSSLDRLVAACGEHQSLHGVRGHAVHHTERERRFLKHPKRVLHIDSIYRGRA